MDRIPCPEAGRKRKGCAGVVVVGRFFNSQRSAVLLIEAIGLR